MLYGPDGRRTVLLQGPDGKLVSKISWAQFTEFERWDEFPERAYDPPMTCDFAFWYKERKFFCTGEDYGFVIVDENWNRLAYDKNFLELLKQPVLDGSSFYDRIEEILFIE